MTRSPIRWEAWTTSPLRLAKGRRGAHKQVEELTPIAWNGPRLQGSSHSYTSWMCLTIFPPAPTRAASKPPRTSTGWG
jgi:hypothetical protein